MDIVYSAASYLAQYVRNTESYLNEWIPQIQTNGEDIASNIDSLNNAHNTRIDGVFPNFAIWITDPNNPISISESQFINDTYVIDQIIGPNTSKLIINDVSCSNLLSTLGFSNGFGISVIGVSVLDLSSAVQSSLDLLQAKINNLESIDFLDSSPAISISSSQFATDLQALDKILSPYVLSISDQNSLFQNIPNVGPEIALNSVEGGNIAASMLTFKYWVSDTSINISSKFDSLTQNSNKIIGIYLTDSNPVISISGAQFLSNLSFLNKIIGNYEFNISNPSQFLELTGFFESTGPEIAYTFNASQAIQNATSHLTFAFDITDSSLNIASNLDEIQSLGNKVTQINITDYGPLDITYTQLISDSTALSKIYFWVSNNGQFLGGLSCRVNVSGVSVTNVSSVLSLASAFYVNSIAITDTSANIASNLDALQSNASKITSITQSGTPVALAISATQLANDATALSKMSGAYTLAITDTSANIAANLDELQANAANITSITQSGTPTALAITATQLANDATALSKMSGAYTLAITDTSANIAANLDELQANAANITSITQSGTPTALAITATQLANDATALSKMSGSYTLYVSGVAAGSVTNTLSNSHVASITVTDTSVNIASNLDALQSNASKIASITQSGTPAALAISATQLADDATALSKMSGAYTLVITDTSANIASNLDVLQANASKITGIIQSGTSAALAISATQLANDATALSKMSGAYTLAITDTSANIASNLDALQRNASKITGITQSGTPAALAISATQLANDATALGLISGSYSLNVSGVPAGNMTSTLSNSHVVSITVTDTSANIASNLDALQTNASNITSITQSGTPAALAISATQLANDATALGLISGSYSLNVSGVPAGSMTSTLRNSHVVSITVTDTSANIASNLDALQTNASNITSITQSGTPVALAISATQLANDATALSKMSGAYTLAITDTSANIAANLDELQANAANITSITQSGTPTALAITATQLANDATALSKMSGAYTLAITDTSANIAANLDELQANAANITSITQSGTPTALAITATQLANDATALGKISGVYTLAITDSSVNVASNFDVLNQSISKISSISLYDLGNLVTLTESQFKNDQAVLNKIRGFYYYGSLSISNVIAADAYSFIGGSFGSWSNRVQSISIADTAANVISNWNNIVWGFNSWDLNYISTGYSLNSVNIVDTSSNISSNLNSLQSLLNFHWPSLASSVSSISLTDPTGLINVSASQLVSDSAILSKIIGQYNLSISAVQIANISSLLANPHNKNLTVPYVNSSNLSIDLTSYLDVTYNTKTINGGVDTEIDLSINGVGHTIILQGDTPNQVQVLANYSSSINNISAIGLSPDHSTLLITFSSGASTSVPYAGGSGSVTLGGTTYATSALQSAATSSGAASVPTFTDNTGGGAGYTLPTVYSGPVSSLQYQLFDNTDGAVITAPVGTNDFIYLSSTNTTANKATNGNGGQDVIAGGVGSSFIAGGTNHQSTFFLDGRAAGVSWSTITDFNIGTDSLTIWGWNPGDSNLNTSNPVINGATGYTGLTLYMNNLAPDGSASNYVNPALNQITLSNHTLAEFGYSSIAALNAELQTLSTEAINNSGPDIIASHTASHGHFTVGQTTDNVGTGIHWYLNVH